MSFLFLLTCAALLNYLINPYSLFPSSSISGFNLIKPKAGDRGRVIKPYQSRRVNPRTLIVGNSRPEMGLDLNNCDKEQIQPSYNLGIPGAGVYMQTRYAQHVIFSGSVETILFGVDFIDFLVINSAVKFSEWASYNREFDKWLIVNQLNEINNYYLIYKTKNYLEGLFSLESLIDSTSTLFNQSNRYAATRRGDGFNPANDYYEIILTEGQEVLFRQKEKEIYKAFSNSDLVIFQGTVKWSVVFESVNQFINLAKEQGIHLILFINPYHVAYLDTIYKTQKWELLMDWKRILLEISNYHDIPLWDFNGFNEFTSENIPINGDKKTVLDWFWEPAHYRKELGDIMLSKMLPDRCPDPGFKNAANFGILLSEKNLDRHLDQLGLDLNEYAKNH